MTVARRIVPGLTYMITRRCTQQLFFFRHDKRVRENFLYCLAEAAERFGITVFGWMVMSNHIHLVVRDNLGKLPEFLAHFHKMIAKTMNKLLRRCENFWSTQQTNVVHLVEARDRLAKLVYVLANPVAAHLVEHTYDWPGESSWNTHLNGRAVTVRRPRGFFRDDGPMPDAVTMRVPKLDGFEKLTDAAWSTLIRDAVREKEARARRERAEKRLSVLGRKAVLRALPTDSSKTSTPRGKLHPTIACLEVNRRRHELRKLREFLIARKAALIDYGLGTLDVLFPFGTYRIRGNFQTAPPPEIAPLSA